MSQRKNVTGRDGYLILEALTFAVEALSRLPMTSRPDSNIDDMKRLIDASVRQDAALSQLQKIAQRRLTMLLAHVGKSGEVLIFIGPQHLAGYWVHKMHPRTCRAGRRLIDLALIRCRIVSEPALHIRPCRWASVDQREGLRDALFKERKCE